MMYEWHQSLTPEIIEDPWDVQVPSALWIETRRGEASLLNTKEPLRGEISCVVV
jgi:hypothetical protein